MADVTNAETPDFLRGQRDRLSAIVRDALPYVECCSEPGTPCEFVLERMKAALLKAPAKITGADKDGRPYALVDQVRAGAILQADSGFVCMHGGELLPVHANAEGHLYVPCSKKSHLLDGQIVERDGAPDFYMGLHLVEAAK